MLKMAGIDDHTIDSCLEKIWKTPEMLLNTKLIKKGTIRETYSEMRVSRSDGGHNHHPSRISLYTAV